jgi:hypothetical protein
MSARVLLAATRLFDGFEAVGVLLPTIRFSLVCKRQCFYG